MNYKNVIERIYEHLENDQVDKAVMACLRIARHLKDYVYAAAFLREMHPTRRECTRIIRDDTSHLKEDVQKAISKHSLELWIDTHTLDYSLGTDDKGEDKNLLVIGISTIDPELKHWERAISDLHIPPGMNEYDTAAITNQYLKEKIEIRIRMKAMLDVKQRVKMRCLNYAIRIERQLEAQKKSQNFLSQIHTDVNNYFKANAEDVYAKLHRAAQLIDSSDTEDSSLLLTQIRRAIKASADYFYPPSDALVKCSDGKERPLGEEQYLNRLNEYLIATFDKSSSRDLLRSEFDYLSVFIRRLNNVASKGVHTCVSPEEAKQGLLGLYMFLYNITSRLQQTASR